MVVSTPTDCPLCREQGVTEKLQYDVGLSRTFCNKGHEVTKEQIEGKAPLAVAPAADPAPRPDTPPPVKFEFKPFSMTPPPEQASAPPDEPEKALTATPPVLVGALAKKPNGHLSPLEMMAKLGYRQLAGGDIMVEVRIPERFVGHLMDRSGVYYPDRIANGTAFHEHVQHVFDMALELGWAD